MIVGPETGIFEFVVGGQRPSLKLAAPDLRASDNQCGASRAIANRPTGRWGRPQTGSCQDHDDRGNSTKESHIRNSSDFYRGLHARDIFRRGLLPETNIVDFSL